MLLNIIFLWYLKRWYLKVPLLNGGDARFVGAIQTLLLLLLIIIIIIIIIIIWQIGKIPFANVCRWSKDVGLLGQNN